MRNAMMTIWQRGFFRVSLAVTAMTMMTMMLIANDSPFFSATHPSLAQWNQELRDVPNMSEALRHQCLEARIWQKQGYQYWVRMFTATSAASLSRSRSARSASEITPEILRLGMAAHVAWAFDQADAMSVIPVPSQDYLFMAKTSNLREQTQKYAISMQNFPFPDALMMALADPAHRQRYERAWTTLVAHGQAIPKSASTMPATGVQFHALFLPVEFAMSAYEVEILSCMPASTVTPDLLCDLIISHMSGSLFILSIDRTLITTDARIVSQALAPRIQKNLSSISARLWNTILEKSVKMTENAPNRVTAAQVEATAKRLRSTGQWIP